MIIDKIIEGSSEIYFRHTPWDEKSLGIPTAEILEIKYENQDDFESAFIKFEKICSDNKIRFVYTRIDFENKSLRRLLMIRGFYVGETSLQITKKNINKYDLKLPMLTLNDLRRSSKMDLVFNSLCEIARDSFDYGRFHDDVFIDNSLARKRYLNWMQDLIEQDNEIYYFESKGEIIGFHIQKLLNPVAAELVFTGAKKGSTGIAVPIWHSVLINLRDRGIAEANTLISGSNIGVMNLYSLLGFSFNKSLIGLHKRF
jgi:hypothetical protein